MKCTNCGNELTGKFCTNCGTPAPQEEVTTEQTVVTQQEMPEMQAEQNVQIPQPFEYNPQTGLPNNEVNVPVQPIEQPAVNQTSYGQQFTNQKSDYTGQQFTNQPVQKKGMSGGKIAIIIVSIFLGVILLLGIIGGIVACNVVNKMADVAGSYIDDYSGSMVDIIDDFESKVEEEFSNDEESDDEEEYPLYDESSRFYYEPSEDYDGWVITGYEMDYSLKDNDSKNIEIRVPDKIEGMDVVEIKEIHAYYNDKYVTVIIPGTVKTIRSYSMSFVDLYDEVIIEDGVKEIEKNAFIGDEELLKVTVPESVTEMEECGIGMEVDEEYDPIPMKNFVLYGKKGSVAEAYAKKNRLKFEEK